MKQKFSLALTVAGLLFGGTLLAPQRGDGAPVFIPPGGEASGYQWPTENWSRGDAGGTYAEWNSFDSPEGPNPPDAGYVGFADSAAANVALANGSAFITSTGNIYSTSGATAFDVTLPGAGTASVGASYLVAQINTLGSELDPNSLRLSYDDGDQQLTPLGSMETHRLTLGGFGGDEVTTLYWWELSAVSPAEYQLQFSATDAHMSLAELVIDAYSLEGAGPPRGDYDGNGVVDGNDFAAWRSEYGMDHDGGLGAASTAADGNGDGTVDAIDYAIWREQLTAGPPALVIPEPTGTEILAIVSLAALFCGWVTRYGRSPGNRTSANAIRRI